MTEPTHYFTKTIFIATYLILGCTSGGMLGCGSGDGNAGPTVDSELPGVYAIDSYRGSPIDGAGSDICDQLSDIEDAPSFLVLYSFRPAENLDEPRLGGAFCGDVERCRQLAKDAPEPTIGYSFIRGDDQAGWEGFGISSTGNVADQCLADVQIHKLTSAGQTININTDTVEVTFPPMLDGNQATCRLGDALAALTPDLPCKARLVLDATRDSAL